MSLMEAQKDWEECSIEFLHSYKTFNLARKAAILAEDKPIDSNIDTDYDKPRKRQLPARYTQSSDDDDAELENVCTIRKRQVTGRSHRKIQCTENQDREKCQDVNQVKGVPPPAINIRQQLAALKAQVSHPILKCNKLKSDTKKKVLTTKKFFKIKNDKVSPKNSPPKEILLSHEKSPVKTTDCPTVLQYADAFKNVLQSSLDIDDVTSDLDSLPATQTSAESHVSTTLRDLEFLENSEECSNYDMQNFEDYRSPQQGFNSKENSQGNLANPKILILMKLGINVEGINT